MDHAELFLMASLYEGFPNAVIEANASGIPVIAFNAPGGISEIITNGENGYLVNNDEEFVSAIDHASNHPFDRHQISIKTIDRFSLDKMMSSYEILLMKLYNDKNKNN
jgi:glycosyltransferase involved in cell wall biosynthesis